MLALSCRDHKKDFFSACIYHLKSIVTWCGFQLITKMASFFLIWSPPYISIFQYGHYQYYGGMDWCSQTLVGWIYGLYITHSIVVLAIQQCWLAGTFECYSFRMIHHLLQETFVFTKILLRPPTYNLPQSTTPHTLLNNILLVDKTTGRMGEGIILLYTCRLV